MRYYFYRPNEIKPNEQGMAEIAFITLAELCADRFMALKKLQDNYKIRIATIESILREYL
jgi:hypothetical protein